MGAIRPPRLVRRARLVADLRASGQRPEWAVLTALPVLPPDLRPLVERPDGGLIGCDLTDLYLAVLRANDRYRRLAARTGSSLLLTVAARALQQAVDQLLAGGERGVPAAMRRGRPLRSLAARLAGKGGRLRRDLLGKRVDFSARAVIVADPDLPVGAVGLPRALALELLRPFVLRRLLRDDPALTARAARRLIERRAPAAWDGAGGDRRRAAGAAQPGADAPPAGAAGLPAAPGRRPRHPAAGAGLRRVQRRLRRRPDGRPPAAVRGGPGRGRRAPLVGAQRAVAGDRPAQRSRRARTRCWAATT